MSARQEKWTSKKTETHLIYYKNGTYEFGIPNELVEQLQSEAFSKGQFEALKASQIRIYLDKKIEEARADERKKVLLFIKNSRLVYGLDDLALSGLLEKELTTHKYGVIQNEN